MWTEHEFDKAARIAAEMGLKDYVEKLEAIAELTKRAAAEKVVDSKKRARIDVFVTHTEKQALFTAKYGVEETRVSLNIEEMGRYALLANLAATIVPDFSVKGIRYRTSSAVQAADRLLMLGILVPGEHMLSVRRVYMTAAGLSPFIELWTNRQKTIESPVHRLALNAVWEIGLPNKDYILAIAWLFISTIINTPDDGRSSEGLVELAKRLAAKGGRSRDYETALEPLRPYAEGLDALLGTITREDKVFLMGKMVDYKGRMVENRAIIYIDDINDMIIKANGVEINMVDVIATATNEFRRLNVRRALISLGIPPIDGPAIKAVAALRVRERRLNELLEYGEPIKIGDVEVIPIEAKEIVVEIMPENLNEIIKGFREGYYTHLRLIDGHEKYDLVYYIKYRAMPVFASSAKRGPASVVEKAGIRPSKSGVAFTINRLPALLSAGIKAYAVRKAKKGEAEWIVRIGDIELKMTHTTRDRLQKCGEGGIPAIIGGRLKMLDLRKLAERGCGDCPEGRMVKALSAAGIKWSILRDAKCLVIYLPRR